jgi:ABC-type nitrate/sulfonate/bicarbonate transport system substrate-binding protein
MRLVQNIFLPNAALIAAHAIGAFEANGVEVVTTFTRSSLDQRAALLAGDADVAVTALDNLFAWNDGDEGGFRAVAQIERATSLPVYVRSGLASLDDLASLERPRLIVDSPASGFGIALVGLVTSLGVAPDRRQIVAAGGVNERLASLTAGEGDVALLAPFVAAPAATAGLAYVTSLEELYPDYPGLVVVTSDRRIAGEDAALRAYLRALTAGRDMLNAEPDAAIEALLASGLAEPAARAQLALCGSGPLTVSRAGFELLRDLRAGQGLLPHIACGFDDFVTHRFLNAQED